MLADCLVLGSKMLTWSFVSFCFAEKRENVMHVLLLHGGHLGFFEGSVLFPEPLTWMDKLVVQYANAICQWEKTKSHCSDTEQAVSGQE